MADLKFYLVEELGDANNQKLCIVDNFVSGINAESWRVHTGEALTPVFPTDARIYLTGEESGIKLSSFVGNSRSMCLASKELKDLIAEHVTESIEYLPVAICDHRKRTLGPDYFIVNPLGAIDCLDLAKSRVMYSKKDPTKIVQIRDYVLDRKKLEKAPQLFRMEHSRATYVVGSALAQAIRARKDITNVEWEELPFGDGN
jgi:hypothetical protein